ncbi:MAG: thioredoxin TrxA [Bacillota bacterium]
MLELNKENFEAEVLQHGGAVLVDFWSPKCDPCTALLPDVEALAEKYGSQVKFCKVNAIENRRLSIAQKVLGLPTILLFKDGERVAELTKEEATAENIEAKLKEVFGL